MRLSQLLSEIESSFKDASPRLAQAQLQLEGLTYNQLSLIIFSIFHIHKINIFSYEFIVKDPNIIR